jgi:HD superfamily phosphohydrolase
MDFLAKPGVLMPFVIDPLYGSWLPPSWLLPYILSPEVQRLRDVRLINTSSPYMAALSDCRRFTHSLGVLRLGGIFAARNALSREDERHLLLAALIHDLGTPAFGHVFEYLLKASTGWTHEGAVADILTGEYRPDGVAHQIYYGNGLSLGHQLARDGFDIDYLAQLVVGGPPLGQLVAGQLDLDNMDNVARMSHALGYAHNGGLALRLASSAIVQRTQAVVFASEAREAVMDWRELRRKCYRQLFFSGASLVGQAMLTDALSRELEARKLSEEHWFYTDEQLLLHLRANGLRETREIIQRFVVGDYYKEVFLGWYAGAGPSEDLRSPEARLALRSALESALGVPISPYVLYDRGAMEKGLHIELSDGSFLDADASSSVIIGLYTRRRSGGARSSMMDRVLSVLEDFGLMTDCLRVRPREEEIHGVPRQAELPF